MARIRIKYTPEKNFIKNQIKNIQKLSNKHLKESAEETAIVLKQEINNSIGRGDSTGNLENYMFAEKTPNGYGVGNISHLNKQAPYWRHVDQGSIAIGASHDHRVPSGAFQPGSTAPTQGVSDQRWFAGSGSFSFIPTKPIAPLNYISKMLQKVPSIVGNIVRRG